MYKKRVRLVEPTKILERETVDNLRFINPLGHDYVSGAYNVSPEEDGTTINRRFATLTNPSNPESIDIKNDLYANVYKLNSTLYIYELCFWIVPTSGTNISMDPTSVDVIAPNGVTIWKGSAENTTRNTIGSIILDQVGEYKIKYYPNQNMSATYSVYVLNNTTPKKPYTITEVINRILNAGLGARNGYYKLDPVFAEKWKDIQAPEFEITGKTLYEALLMVCGYKNIQAIPRLTPTPDSEEDWEYNFITFDELNGDKVWTPPSEYLAKEIIWDGESYCGGIESYVDNFVDNTDNGSARMPFPSTVRTESTDLIIDENYAIIKTDFPIYKVNKVTQAYINGDGEQVGDITPYIFEKSEYDNLSSYVGGFPNAKQFAMYYIQGQPNIYGLVLKPQTATALGLALQDFAAVQIAEKRSGQKYDKSNGVPAFAYTVEYTPISGRRIRQFKPTREFPNSNALYYNQSANIVDSKNYGGRMKGELARIGNRVEIETYRLYNLADIPEAGMKKDGKYISQVDWEIQATSIKVTIHLIKNYNRLSQYIGINSLQRYYEVSEKQATDRKCNFSYFARVGTGDVIGKKTILTIHGRQLFADTFKPTAIYKHNKIAFVVATPLAKDGTPIQSPTVHTVLGSGIGNSMSFYFSYEDNYSAGGQALYNASAKKVQKAVPYGDEYGEFYALKMDFYTFNANKSGGFRYSDQLSTATSQGFCDKLPEINPSDIVGAPPAISYTAVIDKNGGEKISVETQIHFQANLSDVIIGSALGEDNVLVSGKDHTHTFVCLPYKIEYLQESIPVGDIAKYAVANPTVGSGSDDRFSIGQVVNTTAENALSWACVNEAGEILIARNEDIPIGDRSKQEIYFNLIMTIE